MKRTTLACVLLVPVSVLLSSAISSEPQLYAQTAAPATSGATAAWTLKVRGEIRWQQVTPMGALLVFDRRGASGCGHRAWPGHVGEA